MAVFLRLFGGLQLEAPGAALPRQILHKKRLALLALLAVSKRLSRDKLAGFLWPEHDEDKARHQLASAIYELRRALGENAVESIGDTVASAEAVIGSDVADFERFRSAGNLEAAVALYGGPFLDGFFITDAEEFERWTQSERDRLAGLYATSLEQLAARAEQRGAQLEAVEWWRKLAAHDRYNSRIVLRLMRALDAVGDRSGALQQLRTHTLLLRDDLGVGPDPELIAAAEHLRKTPPARPAPPSAPLAAAITTSPSLPPTPTPPVRPRRAVLVTMVVATMLVASLNAPHWYRAITAGKPAPVVVMMDSPHRSRVYDEDAVQASGTNADLINDMLRDLPIQRVKETAGPFWHRDEEIKQIDPDLVLIHLSAFCNEQCEPGRVRLRNFIEYLAESDATFLIYSRMPPDTFAAAFREMLGPLPEKYPDLRGRLYTFSLVQHGTPHWQDPTTAAAFKLRVKQLLDLE